MKIVEPIQHNEKSYAPGDSVSDAEAKELPDGYAVTDSEYKKLQKEEATDDEVAETE